VDLNLDTLKQTISQDLERSDFALFRHDSGAFDASLVITWDSETFPDYQMFLDAARKLGIKMIMFATREFEESEFAEAEDDLETSELSRDDRRDYANSLKALKEHIGSTCSIELAFQYETHFYVYEARPDWYEEFVNITDEVIALGSEIEADDDDDESEDDNMGGFYSKN
jgi:hypothetical protein